MTTWFSTKKSDQKSVKTRSEKSEKLVGVELTDDLMAQITGGAAKGCGCH